MLELRRIPLGAWVGLILDRAVPVRRRIRAADRPLSRGPDRGRCVAAALGRSLLGTDNLGRDLLSRMIYGARTTIFVAAHGDGRSRSSSARCSASQRRCSAAGSTADVALRRLADGDPDPDLRAGRAVGPADHAGHPDPGHGASWTRPASTACRGRWRSISTSWISSRPRSCGARGAAGSSSARSCPMHCRRWSREFGLRFVFAMLFLSTLSFLGLGMQPPAGRLGRHGQGEQGRHRLRYRRSADSWRRRSRRSRSASISWSTGCSTAPPISKEAAAMARKAVSRRRSTGVGETLLEIRNLRIEATVYPPGEPPHDVTSSTTCL